LNTTIASNDLNRHSPLADLSASDKPWDTHRSHATTIEGHYRASESHQSYASRMSVCSLLLDFRQVPSEDTLKLKLSAAHFCRVRWCPVCQWRRALMWKSKAAKILPLVLAAYPKHRWLFVTLTVKNCQLQDLRSTINHLNKSYERLSKLNAFPADGWLKAVEVTRSKNGTAHPHLHIIMMVKPSYFGVGYLSTEKWVSLWRKSLRVDYDPVIHIKAIKGSVTSPTMLSEVIKYQVKESDLIVDKDWFIELTKQLHKTRAISSGGILKEYLKELENEPDDLIGDDGEGDDTLAHLYFGWMQHYRQYRQVEVSR
jgi:plasmid rolling circle replication initiator protein Rep